MKTADDKHAAYPERGNIFSRTVGRLFMSALGWKVEGEFPQVPKVVIISAPHTSNWDFVFAIATMFALGLRITWIGKHTLFRWYSDRFMRWIGGLPVDRSAKHDTVAQVVDVFAKKEKLILAVSPEGTRKKVKRWKSGFYHIAAGAGVPILQTYFDYSRKAVRIGRLFEPTGNLAKDMAEIQASYTKKQCKYPDKFRQIGNA